MTKRRPRRRPRLPWTLQRRLVLTVVGLLALVSITIGVVSVVILRASLLDRLDVQLASAADRSVAALSGGGDNDGDRLGDLPGSPYFGTPTADSILSGPAQPPGLLALVYDGSTITTGYTDDRSGAIEALTAQQVQLLADHVNQTAPVTLNLGGELGDYRVQAETSRSGTLYLVGLPLTGVAATAAQLAVIIGLVSLAGLVVVAVIAAWVVRLALRPLQRMTATAARVAQLPLDRGEVSLSERVPADDTDPRTEVGRVGAALNRMLDHVDRALEARQASERKVRQFVADASHELRTPLASIRGYSELTRRSGQELPPDAIHALGRIESESVRMTGLVEDLLLLARLDEGRELDMQPVDLTRVLVDAVSDAHAAGRDHVWNLELPEEPIEAIGDEPRLRQVIANLLANARVHTPAGTTVVIALAAEGNGVVITVTDDGPGIPEGLTATLFERFARGDSSRFRAANAAGAPSTGSTGLGLAIVAAVLAAHHGEVTVDSRPGQTAFRVSLPRA
ncbi:cell wall metabolism sensor histidine kinase WalK [Cryobacterium sp. Y82]|uniref:sensor histidine kinase n=1 Tax=Cryobacterium sp. Y82 TaxID=2045017 RepID=UPI000CE39C10|nr:HAMP domain-containing sensor histidine kinase [Cryobacterium sp. Y82]